MQIKGFSFGFFAASAMALSVSAQEIRPADRDRFQRFDEILGAALREALAEGPAADKSVLLEAMSGSAGPLSPVGDWNCRTIKVGGILPLIAYPNFRCRITAEAPGIYRLVKLTGSQRVDGQIYDGGSEALFLGVGHVNERPDVTYDQFPPNDQTPIGINQSTPDVGLFEQMSPNRARVMFPDPILESDFDILYLTR